MKLIDLLAPRSCAFCGTLSEEGERCICKACLVDLPWNEPACSATPGMFERVIAMSHYSFPVDVAIKALKFDRKLFYAAALSEMLCRAESLLADDIDGVLPVPLHWRRKAVRGFNQATEIAKPVAKLLGVPLLRGVHRGKATPFQSGLAAKDREQNLQHAFRVQKTLTRAHVLIVDDVITTGATLRAVAKILLVNGVRRVSALTVARAG